MLCCCSSVEDGKKMAIKKKLSAILNLNNVFQKSLDLAQAAMTCCLAANSLRTALGLV